MKQYSMRNPNLATWLGGIAIGAAAMYLADPVQGKRRRLLIQDSTRKASARTGNALSSLSSVMHETGNRLSAAQLRAKGMLKREVFDDERLQARVRSAVNKLASVPDEIRIKAEQGCITLTGLASRKERDRLLHKLRRIPGVRELRDHLEMKSTSRTRWFRKEGRHEMDYEPGKAATHGAVLASGALAGAARRLPIGALLAIAGLGYAIQSLGKNKITPSKRIGSVRQDKTIHLQKSIEIQASPETVFNIWSKYDNFPEFMSHLVEIQSLGGQRSHWMMQGPAGVNLEWDTVLTKYMEPTMLAWQTEPGAPIEHKGSVRFESFNGGTRATVRMLYRPAAGTNADNMPTLLGMDPAQELEADLERMKNFIEGKNFPRDLPQATSSSGQILH